jgi:hypothetical protein
VSRTLKWLALLALAIGAAAAWLWFEAPEHLPAYLRVKNPHSSDYAPTVYRWKDDQGRTQLTGEPPPDGRPYEPVVIDPKTNVVPNL